MTFLVTWHFPNLRMDKLPPGRFYAKRFASALDVADYVSRNYRRLSRETRLWHDTWYDSTLPYWFLDRTFLNTSILATSTCFRFGDGRFYGWEGVGCCAGTCGHVWQYAQAMARLFPELERDTRERVDFGLALKPDGAICFRGEFNNIPAVDGQAGTILRALREHQMSADAAWLKRNWPGIKKATEWLIAKDGDGDGLIAGNQHNTLDTDWFGPVAWLSGLYLAALLAAAAHGRPGWRRRLRRAVPWHCRARTAPAARRAFRRRVLHQPARPEASGRDQLRHRLRHRPGHGPELGLPGGPAARAAGEGDRVGAASRSGATTSRRTWRRIARPTRPAAGTRCRARRAC